MPRTKQHGLIDAPKAVTPVVQTEVVFDGGEWSGLTDKQRLFIEHYFICGLNATEAALAVYDAKNRENASRIGSENLRHPAIRARIDERLDQFHLSANEVLARIAFHARGSMEDFIDPDSGTIDLKKAKQAKQLGLIKRYKTKFTTTSKQSAPTSLADDEEKVKRVTTEETEVMEIELELYDAQAALRDLGKHHKLFGPDIEVNFLAGRKMEDLSIEELQQIKAGKSLKAGGA